MQVARLLEGDATADAGGKLRQIAAWRGRSRRASARTRSSTLYLTLAPYGGNIEGVRAASLAYFGKEPTRLTIAEAALLVALPQSPEARRPDRDPDAARAARDRVLDRLAGAGVIDADDGGGGEDRAGAGGAAPFPMLAAHLGRGSGRRASPTLSRPSPHHRPRPAGLARSPRRAARAAARAEALRRHRRRRPAERRRSSPRSARPACSRTSATGHVDMTRAVRSPGSTLKPLIYGLAFEDGPRASRKPDRRPADRLRRLCAGELRRLPSRHRHHPRGADPVAQRAGDHRPRRGRAGAAGGAHEARRRSRRCSPTCRRRASPSASAASASRCATSSSSTRRSPAAAPRSRLRDGVDDAAGPAATASAPVLDRRPPPGTSPTSSPARRRRSTARPAQIAFKTGTSYGYRDAWAIGFDGADVDRRLDRPAGRHAGAGPLRHRQRRADPVRGLRPAGPEAGAACSARRRGARSPLDRRAAARRSAASATRDETAVERDGDPEIAFPLDGVEVDLGIKDGDPTPLVIKVRNGAPALHLLRQRRADRPRAPSTARRPGSPTARASSRSRWSTPTGRSDRVTVFLE